jgi:hypothetical protein
MTEVLDDARKIEINFEKNGRKLLINVDGQCRVQGSRIGELIINDERRPFEALRAAVRKVLARCGSSGGEIDAALVAELRAALGDDN